MKRILTPLLCAIPLWLTGCGSSTNGHMVGELAWDRVELSNEAAEPISAIKVHEGQQVEAGALLLQLDAARAKAALSSAAAKSVEAKQELERQQKLIKQNLTSPERLGTGTGQRGAGQDIYGTSQYPRSNLWTGGCAALRGWRDAARGIGGSSFVGGRCALCTPLRS